MRYTEYVRAESLQQAYELGLKKNNRILGGTLWLKMQDKNLGTAIDLCDLGLDQIEENDEEFKIGAYVSLHQLEEHEGLNSFTGGAMRKAVESIVGVQFRNCATIGGSLWGRFGFSDVLTLFLALGAKVELYDAGIVDMDEFAELPRNFRDLLVSVILPKGELMAAYESVRNQATDFPVISCAVAKRNGTYMAAVGARPAKAKLVIDKEGILSEVTEENILRFAEYVRDQITFGESLRAGSAYRKAVCPALVKRAIESMEKGEEPWK